MDVNQCYLYVSQHILFVYFRPPSWRNLLRQRTSTLGALQLHFVHGGIFRRIVKHLPISVPVFRTWGSNVPHSIHVLFGRVWHSSDVLRSDRRPVYSVRDDQGVDQACPNF